MAIIRSKTDEFLLQVSRHLSGKSCCRNQPYKLVIDNFGNVTFSHMVPILKPVKHRSVWQSSDVIDHVLRYHMNDICADTFENKSVHKVDVSCVVPGIYHYTYFNGAMKRRWIVDSLLNR